MKKLLLMMILCLVMSATCSAARIRLCDFGVYNFVNTYNQYAKNYNENIIIDKNPYIIPELSDGDYTIHYCECGQEGHKTGIMIIVNKEGYIEGFSISLEANKLKDQYSTNNFSDVVLMVINTFGLNSDERMNFRNQLSKNNFRARLWSNSSKKYINSDCSITPSKQFVVRFYATDN